MSRCHQLIDAIRNGNQGVVLNLLQTKADPNYDQGEPLIEAVLSDNFELVKILLNHRAEPNLATQRNPLFIAVNKNSVAIVKLLLELDLEFDWPINQFYQQAVELAVDRNYQEIVEVLLDYDSRQPSQDTKYLKSFNWAIEMGDYCLVRMFVEYYQKLEQSTAPLLETSLTRAATFGQTNIVSYLLKLYPSLPIHQAISCTAKTNSFRQLAILTILLEHLSLTTSSQDQLTEHLHQALATLINNESEKSACLILEHQASQAYLNIDMLESIKASLIDQEASTIRELLQVKIEELESPHWLTKSATKF